MCLLQGRKKATKSSGESPTRHALSFLSLLRESGCKGIVGGRFVKLN